MPCARSSRVAVASEGVIDIFAAAGLEKPDISILSDEFLSEVRGMERRNLAVELLQKLLKGELAARRRKNVVQARSFAEMLEQTLRRYQNRTVEAAQVIRGTDPACPRHARGWRPRRASRAVGRRSRLLRRARDQRQRGTGPRRRDPARHRPRDWSTPCAAMLPSTGPCARTSAPTCAVWSSVSCASTDIRPTNRRRLRELVLEQAEALSAGWAA